MSIPRIHCHSAFRHYEMFHNNCGSSYGNSIFNTTYNFNGGNICGGGFFGGLLGGLGMGLGAGLMNWLGGGFNMFGGMMGGFPMMNMFGGGFNMFGGGFPMMNMWGMGGGSRNVDGAGGKDKAKDKNDNNTTTKCGGKDAEYLHTLRERFNKIKTSSDPGKEALDLLNDINAVIATQKDDEHDDIDEKNYKDLKTDLEKEWKFELDKDGKAIKAEPKNTQAQPDVTQAQPDVTQTRAQGPGPEVTEPTNNQPAETVTDGNLTNKKIAELTDEEFNNILKDQNKVRELLGHNKRLNTENNPNTVKVPRNYKELVLAQKSGLKIQFCKNTTSEGNSKKSATIMGDIESITRLNNEDQIYTVVIKDKGEYTLQFNFNEGNNTVEVLEAKGAKIDYTDDEGNPASKKLKNLSQGKPEDIYHIGDDWATREGDPLVR